MFDLISDFHAELNHGHSKSPTLWYDWEGHKNSDLLVIAGDMGNDISMALMVVKEAAMFYKQVVFVDGNHEHYGWGKDGNTENVVTDLKKFCNRYIPNAIHLNSKNRVLWDDNKTAFVGCNAWYDFKLGEGGVPTQTLQKGAWHQNSNDVRIYFAHDPEHYARIHALRLKENIENLNADDRVENIVVVTHTVPRREFLMHQGNYASDLLSGAYGSWEMQELTKNAELMQKVKVWCFGHTHEKFDVDYVNDIRFICNPRGYYEEHKLKPQMAQFQGTLHVKF